MKEPLGEFGGVVTRKLTLFKKVYSVGDELTPELLGKVSIRHRRALAGAGLVRYFSEPEGVVAFVSDDPLIVKTTEKTEQAPTKRETHQGKGSVKKKASHSPRSRKSHKK